MTGRGLVRIFIAAAAGAGLAVTIAGTASTGAWAAGSPSCASGQEYSDSCGRCMPVCKKKGTAHVCKNGKDKGCVKQSAQWLNDDALYREARSLIEGGQYVRALEKLWSIGNQDDAKVLTYIGYATRKLGNVERGIGYYHKALALNPDFVRAREYLGEGYLQKGDVESAKGQLHEIAARCGTDCREYVLLTNAIVEHETGEKRDTATW